MPKAKYKEWLKPDNLTKIRKWARDGFSEEHIATDPDKMNIAYSTFREWKKKYPALSAVLKKSKLIVNAEVEDSLLKTMKGYKLTTTTYRMVKKDRLVLQAERLRYKNEYQLSHPEATKNEILIAVAENVDVYKRIPASQVVSEVGPNVSSIIFWLKNREPDLFRDQTFKKLNEANARKALADANISEQQLKALKEADNPDNKTVIVDDVAKMKELKDKNANSSDNQGD